MSNGLTAVQAFWIHAGLWLCCIAAIWIACQFSASPTVRRVGGAFVLALFVVTLGQAVQASGHVTPQQPVYYDCSQWWTWFAYWWQCV